MNTEFVEFRKELKADLLIFQTEIRESLGEFKKEIRQDLKDTRENVALNSQQIAVVTKELGHKQDEAKVIKLVDRRIYYHKRDCREGNTGSVDIPAIPERPKKRIRSFLSRLSTEDIVKMGLLIGALVVGVALAIQNMGAI